jgi:hypothetical protein
LIAFILQSKFQNEKSNAQTVQLCSYARSFAQHCATRA